jgi:hypothetical protein
LKEEEEVALESEEEGEEKGESKAGDVLLDDAMVQRWLSNYREPTRSEYLKVFRRYFRWLRYKRKIPAGAKPTDLIKDHLKCLYSTPYDDLESKLKHTNWLLEYVDYLRKKGLSMWTVSHAVKIRSFYAFSAAPLQKFRVPTDPEMALRRVSRQVIPSVREWLTLIPHLSEWGRSLTYFLMYTGLRLNEALLLTTDNLNPERDEKAAALYRRGLLIVDPPSPHSLNHHTLEEHPLRIGSPRLKVMIEGPRCPL